MEASKLKIFLFDQKVLHGRSIKMKRVSENFPLTAHLNTLSVPVDAHFSKLKISKWQLKETVATWPFELYSIRNENKNPSRECNGHLSG